MRHSGSGNDSAMMQHEMDAGQETFTLEDILAEFRAEPLPPPESAPTPPPSGSGNIGRIYRQTRASVQGRPLRLGLCLVLTLCGLTLGVLRCQGMLEEFPNWTLLTYLEMTLLLCCTLLAADAIAGSLVELPRSGFRLTCLMPLLILLALADSILSLQAPRATYCPLVCLELCAALWGAQLRDRALCSTLEPAGKMPATCWPGIRPSGRISPASASAAGRRRPSCAPTAAAASRSVGWASAARFL